MTSIPAPCGRFPVKILPKGAPDERTPFTDRAALRAPVSPGFLFPCRFLVSKTALFHIFSGSFPRLFGLFSAVFRVFPAFIYAFSRHHHETLPARAASSPAPPPLAACSGTHVQPYTVIHPAKGVRGMRTGDGQGHRGSRRGAPHHVKHKSVLKTVDTFFLSDCRIDCVSLLVCHCLDAL